MSEQQLRNESSEGLHNQVREQQARTPELVELSRELWTTCEQLLKERGRNSVCRSSLLKLLKASIGHQLFITSKGEKDRIMLELINETPAKQSVMNRHVELEGEKAIITVCGDLIPVLPQLPPVSADVYIAPKNNESGVNTEFLRLHESRRAEIMRPKQDGSPLIRRHRWATIEDLLYYQNQISKGSPIEHK